MPVLCVREPGNLLNAAIAHHRAGRLAEAERGYETVLSLDPANVDALNMLGVIKAMKNDLEQAERLIATALRGAPKAPLVLLNYGNVLSAQGRDQVALEHFDRALALDPRMVRAWINRASSLRKLGRSAEALTSVDRALTLSRPPADLHNLRGEILFELRRFGDAWKEFDRALKINPKSVAALFMQAQICVQEQRQSEALALLDEVLKIKPEFVTAQYLWALCALPMAAVSEAEASRASEVFAERISALRSLGFEEAHLGIGTLTLFGLTYQERNNRQLFVKYGALCADAMAHWQRQKSGQHSGKAN